MSARRPAPLLTEDNHEFWDAAAEHRLAVQRCSSCGHLHHPPRPMCPDCGSLEHEMATMSGRATVYSYALLHHPQHPAFEYPVVAAIVELEEGPRLVTNIVGCEPSEVSIGMPVEVRFVEAGEDAAVPVFAPVVDR